MNRKEKRRKKHRIVPELHKRLDAIIEHAQRCKECVDADKWASGLDQIRKAGQYCRSSELDLHALRELFLVQPGEEAKEVFDLMKVRDRHYEIISLFPDRQNTHSYYRSHRELVGSEGGDKADYALAEQLEDDWSLIHVDRFVPVTCVEGYPYKVRLATEEEYLKARNIEQVTFVGVDNFNRPIFQSVFNDRNFYGSCDKLFDSDAGEDKVLVDVMSDDLTFFGSFFGCEPMGTQPGGVLEIVLNNQVEKMPKLHRLPAS